MVFLTRSRESRAIAGSKPARLARTNSETACLQTGEFLTMRFALE